MLCLNCYPHWNNYWYRLEKRRPSRYLWSHWKWGREGIIIRAWKSPSRQPYIGVGLSRLLSDWFMADVVVTCTTMCRRENTVTVEPCLWCSAESTPREMTSSLLDVGRAAGWTTGWWWMVRGETCVHPPRLWKHLVLAARWSKASLPRLQDG